MARCWRCSFVSLCTAWGDGWCWGGLPPVKLLERLLTGDASGERETDEREACGAASSRAGVVPRCSLLVMAGGRNTPVPNPLLLTPGQMHREAAHRWSQHSHPNCSNCHCNGTTALPPGKDV